MKLKNTVATAESLYRVAEAAAILAVRPTTLRKWIFERRIAVHRPGGHAVRIAESEIVRIQREGFTPRREGVR